MSLDRARWAEALAIEKWQGEGAPRYVAKRISALAAKADWVGVARMREIADCLDQLRGDGARRNG